MEEFSPVGSEKRAKHWKGIQDALHLFKGWLAVGGSEKLFFMGDRISNADVTIASFLQWLKLVLGESSQEWRDITQWDGGHWARLMQEFGKYDSVDVGDNLQS